MLSVEDYNAFQSNEYAPKSDGKDPCELFLNRNEIEQAPLDDLYEKIYLTEERTIEGSAMLFRCSLVVASILIAVAGTQFYKDFSQGRQATFKTTDDFELSSQQDSNNPGIDPITTASVPSESKAKIIERPDLLVGASQLQYSVRPGDTLSAIGERYGTTAAKIMAVNKIEDADVIRPGMILMIDRSR